MSVQETTSQETSVRTSTVVFTVIDGLLAEESDSGKIIIEMMKLRKMALNLIPWKRRKELFWDSQEVKRHYAESGWTVVFQGRSLTEFDLSGGSFTFTR